MIFYAVWKIYEHEKVAKQLKVLPIDVLKKYEKWKDVVSIRGQDGLRQMKGFRDEALQGEWLGDHSSRLNFQYRVIFKLEKDLVLLQVVNVIRHDDRKK